MANPLEKISIYGFKSIKQLVNLNLNNLNILIGPNGAGKSNFIQFFEMLNNLIKMRLQFYIKDKGGADQFLFQGLKVTKQLHGELYFGLNGYKFILEPTEVNSFIFAKESMYFKGVYFKPQWYGIGTGQDESHLKDKYEKGPQKNVASYIYPSILSWMIYHFHDTSKHALVKQPSAINDNEKLNPDAGNLAAYLFALEKKHPDIYTKILNIVQLVAPFISEFKLRPIPGNEDNIQFEWLQKNSDFPFKARHLSDGTLRFICLVTALMQPNPPATILLDEPELGLHPYALARFADLLKIVKNRTQLIVSTQSSQLLDHFEPEDIIVVERTDEGESVFKKMESIELKNWLDDYSLGELWEKNVLGGRP